MSIATRLRSGRSILQATTLWSRPHCTSAPPECAMTAADVMSRRSNRAMRYVFTRTLPLRSQPEFENESAVKCVVEDIEVATRRLVVKHIWRAVDERAGVHLHTAALAVGAHRSLQGRIRDEVRIMNILRGAFGAGANASDDAKLPGYWVGKAALLFSPNRMAAVRKMTRNAASDFGTAFEIDRADGANVSTQADNMHAAANTDTHRMTVNQCFYADFCTDEGVPHLTKIFCSLDRALFSHISPKAHGVFFEMSNETLADGKEHPCRFDFTRVKK